MVVGSTKLPRYVLRDGRHPVGLSISHDSTVSVSAIYGFSDKPQYDHYLAQCTQLLTPYPLVKGFLQNQIEASPDSLQLVVLDATSPTQTRLEAATMEAIFEALKLKQETICASHQLSLDPMSATYRIVAINDPATDKVSH